MSDINNLNEDKDVGTYLAFDDNLNNRGLYYMHSSLINLIFK